MVRTLQIGLNSWIILQGAMNLWYVLMINSTNLSSTNQPYAVYEQNGKECPLYSIMLMLAT